MQNVKKSCLLYNNSKKNRPRPRHNLLDSILSKPGPNGASPSHTVGEAAPNLNYILVGQGLKYLGVQQLEYPSAPWRACI